MVMVVNDSALMAKGLEFGQLPDYFREGRKLRQEWDARQHEKALNELMKVEDFNKRLSLARQSRYAGALVPIIQDYEDKRQKVALENLQQSANIGKTFGETGKLEAEASKDNASAGKTNFEVQKSIYTELIPALANNPTTFVRNMYEMKKKGYISDNQWLDYTNVLSLPVSEQVKFFGELIRQNPKMAEILLPKHFTVDTGGKIQNMVYDPYQAETFEHGNWDKTQSPDNKADNETKVKIADAQDKTSRYISDNQLKGQQYSADKNYAGKQLDNQTKQYQIKSTNEISWFKAHTQKEQGEQKIAIENKKVSGGNQGVGRRLSSAEQKELFSLEDNINAGNQSLQTLQKMLELSDDSKTYSGWFAGGRASFMNNIGLGNKETENTALYENLATGQALSQLKAIFGAAPTEGERKILLDLQASVSKTPNERRAIINQAIEMAKLRIAQNTAKANNIRTGSYMRPQTATMQSQPLKKAVDLSGLWK